jgi:hypothetical protein
MERQLQVLKIFQDRFKDTHVGGSVGLFLRGVDLKRSLDNSDIDLTSKTPIDFTQPLGIENTEESSDPDDFDIQYRYYPNQTSVYIKVEINVNPEKEYDTITHEGIDYRVSKLEDILFWKQKYADKGVEKHAHDLTVINGGERPEPKPVEANEVDDLPF